MVRNDCDLLLERFVSARPSLACIASWRPTNGRPYDSLQFTQIHFHVANVAATSYYISLKIICRK